MAEEKMSFEAIYAIQAFMSLLECELATYEYMASLKKRAVKEFRRQKSIISTHFVSMTSPMLKMRQAIEGSGKVYYDGYRRVNRVLKLLDEVEKAPSPTVIDQYFNKIEAT